MEWANFIAKNLCRWAKEQLGKGASFGEDLFLYDEARPGEVPVFQRKIFSFSDNNRGMGLRIDNRDSSDKADANAVVFLRMRDLYYKPLPGIARPEDCFVVPDIGPHAELLDYIEYSHGDLLMRARMKRRVYRDIEKYGDRVFEVLNNVSLRSILGAMHNLGPVA